MANTYNVEITDTFGGEANYSWVKRQTITMPELTYYGYDGAATYMKANAKYRRALVRKVKALAGWTGQRCEVNDMGDMVEIRPRGACMVAFAVYTESPHI